MRKSRFRNIGQIGNYILDSQNASVFGSNVNISQIRGSSHLSQPVQQVVDLQSSNVNLKQTLESVLNDSQTNIQQSSSNNIPSKRQEIAEFKDKNMDRQKLLLSPTAASSSKHHQMFL